MTTCKRFITPVLILLLCMLPKLAFPADAFTLLPVGIFPFQAKNRDLQEYAEAAGQVLFTRMVVQDRVHLVDREQMDKILNETTLNLSGMVSQENMIQVGQLTGAKIIVSGAVFEVDNVVIIVAKVIGTETSRVFGDSVKLDRGASLIEAAEQLADKVVAIINSKADQLVAPVLNRQDRLNNIAKLIDGKQKPSVSVSITERHVGRQTMDPAAETEIKLILTELGFTLFDYSDRPQSRADIIITGEGFSELATRHKDIVSVKARLEVSAKESSSGRILAVERENEVEIDLSEQFAGKKALQNAAAQIAERMIPRIVELYNL